MLNDFDEVLIDDDIIGSDVLTVLQWDLDAEFVKFVLLVSVEAAMLEGIVILFELSKQTVCLLHNLSIYLYLV